MSGIYIPGMEMPTSCADCRVRLAVGCCGNLPYNTRMPGCPLSFVPPHGRLIDADALDIKRREEQAWHDYERNPDNEYLEGVKDGLHEAAKQLSTAPTIILAEEENE